MFEDWIFNEGLSCLLYFGPEARRSFVSQIVEVLGWVRAVSVMRCLLSSVLICCKSVFLMCEPVSVLKIVSWRCTSLGCVLGLNWSHLYCG